MPRNRACWGTFSTLNFCLDNPHLTAQKNTHLLQGFFWLLEAYLFAAFALKLLEIRCIGALKQSKKQKQIVAQKQPILLNSDCKSDKTEWQGFKPNPPSFVSLRHHDVRGQTSWEENELETISRPCSHLDCQIFHIYTSNNSLAASWPGNSSLPSLQRNM